MSWRRGLPSALSFRTRWFVRSNQNPRRVPQVFSRFSASALGEIVVSDLFFLGRVEVCQPL